MLVQPKTKKDAALKLMRKLLKKYGFAPETFITDELHSYGSAARDLGMQPRHRSGRWRNNRAENSHQPPDAGNTKCRVSKTPDQRGIFPKPRGRLQYGLRSTPPDLGFHPPGVSHVRINTWRGGRGCIRKQANATYRARES